jgi:thiosulfate/3-mercaptopyruvate sulfurtransferase
MRHREYKTRLFVLIAAMSLVAALGSTDSQAGPAAEDTMGTLVTTEWLSQHLDDPDLVVLDCTVHIEMDEQGRFRSSSDRAGYEQGHIPSAGYADLKLELSDTESPMDFALPTPEQFCAAMGALGVGDDSRVVLYDRMMSVWASRVWWMLRWVGFDRAAVLDGGLGAWTAEERPVSTEPVERQQKKLTATVRPALIADRDEVFAAIEDEAVTLIDVMNEAHFTGKMVLYERPGHIPGAVNVPSTALLDETGRFRPQDELAAICSGDRDERVITYCGSGIAASANAFVMTRLGFTDVAVYIASLQEWAADPDNPLVLDEP